MTSAYRELAYTYDKEGNKTSVTEAGGSETSYDYDKLNQLTKVNEPTSIIKIYTMMPQATGRF